MSDSLFDVSIGSYGTTNYKLLDEQNGAERKAVGQRRSMQAADAGTKARIRECAEQLPRGSRVTAEDGRHIDGADVLPPGAWGAVMSGLARAGILRRVGYAQATRSEAHARVLAVWERA